MNVVTCHCRYEKFFAVPSLEIPQNLIFCALNLFFYTYATFHILRHDIYDLNDLIKYHNVGKSCRKKNNNSVQKIENLKEKNI